MYLLQLYMVLTETFVVQRNRQVWSPPHLRTHLTDRKWKPSKSDIDDGAAVPRFQMNGQINIHVLVS